MFPLAVHVFYLQDGASYTLVEDVVVDDEEAAQILAAVEANRR